MSIAVFYGVAPGFVGGDSADIGIRVCALCTECGDLRRGRGPAATSREPVAGDICECPDSRTLVNLTKAGPDLWEIRRTALDAGIPDQVVARILDVILAEVPLGGGGGGAQPSSFQMLDQLEDPLPE